MPVAQVSLLVFARPVCSSGLPIPGLSHPRMLVGKLHFCSFFNFVTAQVQRIRRTCWHTGFPLWAATHRNPGKYPSLELLLLSLSTESVIYYNPATGDPRPVSLSALELSEWLRWKGVLTCKKRLQLLHKLPFIIFFRRMRKTVQCRNNSAQWNIHLGYREGSGSHGKLHCCSLSLCDCQVLHECRILLSYRWFGQELWREKQQGTALREVSTRGHLLASTQYSDCP